MGHRKAMQLMFITLRCSFVRCKPGTKYGGLVGSSDKDSRGSLGHQHTMWKSSGSNAATRCTFFAAFLYASIKVGGVASSCRVVVW